MRCALHPDAVQDVGKISDASLLKLTLLNDIHVLLTVVFESTAFTKFCSGNVLVAMGSCFLVSRNPGRGFRILNKLYTSSFLFPLINRCLVTLWWSPKGLMRPYNNLILRTTHRSN